MSGDLKELRTALTRYEGRLEQLEDDREKVEAVLKKHQREVKFCEQAHILVQRVAQSTQEELTYHLSELVSLALEAVFPDPYEFHALFEIRRGQTECDLRFGRDGNLIEPLFGSGGGAAEVASFALRASTWALAQNKTRPILFLDEPLKWLKGAGMPEKGARMIKEISDKLGLQIIMISHIPDQIEGADRVHETTQKKGTSHVKSR